MRRVIPFLLAGMLVAMGLLCERPHECPECEATDAEVNRLRVLTWNVLADRDMADRRWPALQRALKAADADILAFQEAAPWFLERLLAEPWVRDAYHRAPLGEGHRAPGGVFVLSRFHLHAAATRPLPGRQGRAVLVVDLHVGERHLLVATAHLESFLEDGPVRAKQLGVIFGLLEGAREAVFLGDFNFGDGEEPETGALDQRFVDVWKALRSGDSGFTWDIEKSPMARAASFPGEPSRRLDRILLRSGSWKPASIRILGAAPVDAEGQLFPSDHFGLVAELTRPSR
jgi:endonuclease/exonuclease/phosphatase family metal-dependent hydrolase